MERPNVDSPLRAEVNLIKPVAKENTIAASNAPPTKAPQ
tara:strand:+ start:137 stop:253 length:117 start_codon:yes stop_codon:yes gene_type:complete